MPGTPDASRSEANPRRGRLAEEDGGASLTEQQLGLRQAEERLARDHIHRMLKRCAEFPSFQYVCSLCSVHIENVQLAHKHIKEKRHKKNLMEKQEENELRALAPPAAEQLAALDAVVTDTARRHGVSEDDVAARTHVVRHMGDIIRLHLPACSLRLYGSSLTRFAFKTSDVNIDITVPNTMTQPEVLIRVLEILKNSSEFSDVKSDFHAKVPAVFCRHTSSGLLCNVSTGNELACLTTDHLAALAQLEPRVVPLVLAFRHWGRLVHLDRPEEGGVSSFCLMLLVLFFLQQRSKPLVPVYLGSWVPGFQVKRADEFHLTGILDSSVRWERRPATETRESSQGLAPLSFPVAVPASVGLLWVELLRFFSLDFPLEDSVVSVRLKEALPRDAKSWPRRRLAVEDPFAVKRNVARSLNSQMVFEYLQDRLRAAYRYFANPQRAAESPLRHEVKPAESSRNQDMNNADSPLRQEVNNVDSPLRQEVKPTESSRYQEVNNADSPQGQEVESAESSRNQLVSNTDSMLRQEVEPAESSRNQDVNAESPLRQDVEPAESSRNQEINAESPLRQDVEPAESSRNQEVNAESPLRRDVEPAELSLKQEVNHAESWLKQEAKRSLHQEVSSRKQEVKYVFDKLILTGGKPPTVVCSVCKRDGHVKDECPEDFKKTELQKLPEKNQEFFRILDRLCCSCYEELCLSPLEQQRREQILSGLERFIRKEFNDQARLCLFGSSKNGFGFHDSDLDICMTLEGHDNAEKLNCKEIMEELAKVLKKHTGLRNILPITTAKVPIVKFEHRQSGLEGDVSLYNTLAQHNTRMLATYAALDPRVQLLGYTMKVFAKRCDIGDASRGSLSSYAYILMVLYFLQQRQPPVIPVLQEMFDGEEAPRRTVDGWNAFFYDDLQQLRRGGSANSESVGELWLGLLRFYTEDFSFKEHVVSIRQRRRLTTFEKQWTSKCIAIEDPFDLNHNLGAGVSRKMTNFIMKALINGRKLFGTPFFPMSGTELEYFFDSKVLTDGELAPNDRCCRVCGKIGHYMKDCPRRRRTKKKESERDEDLREDERRCFQCGEPGHTRRDCPEYRHLRHRNAGGNTERGGRTRNGMECVEAPPPFLPSLLGLAQLLVAPPPPPIVFAQAAGGRGYRMPHPHYQLATGPTTLPPHVRHHLNFIQQKK